MQFNIDDHVILHAFAYLLFLVILFTCVSGLNFNDLSTWSKVHAQVHLIGS